MFCPFYFWSNIRNRILVSVYITHATITWRGILEPSNHCWFVYSEIFSRIDQILRNALHFPSFCYRKIQISKNISSQASLHDLFFGFVLCSMLLEIFRVALLFICQGAQSSETRSVTAFTACLLCCISAAANITLTLSQNNVNNYFQFFSNFLFIAMETVLLTAQTQFG